MSPPRSGPSITTRLPLLALSCTLALAGCATQGGGGPNAAQGDGVPDGAQAVTRTESNGDVITEYRIGGLLRLVKVSPVNGPEYFIEDRDGDGIPDKSGSNPPQTYFKLFGWK